MSTVGRDTPAAETCIVVETAPDGDESEKVASSTQTPDPPVPDGYKGLTDIISSDRDFLIFRMFGALAARNLLYIQDELSELEEKLCQIDKADLDSGNPSNSRRHDANDQRKATMKEIERRLKAYQKAILAQSSILALADASFKPSQTLRDRIRERSPVPEPESRFLQHQHDLISLYGDDKKPDYVETRLKRRWAEKLANTKENTPNPGPQDPFPDHLRRKARLITVLSATFLMVVPVLVLWHVTDHPGTKLLLMTFFGFGFAAILAVWTQCRNPEMFMAMAAYLALMLVFTGSSGGSGGL